MPIAHTCQQCACRFETRKATSRFCSKRCYGQAMAGDKRGTYHHRKRAHDLSPTDAAWLAGLFDGEGCIVIVHKDRPTPSVRITITNTNIELLRKVREITGVGSLVHHKTYADHHTPAVNWQTYSANAAHLLQQMLPWLIVKRDKARKVLGESNEGATWLESTQASPALRR